MVEKLKWHTEKRKVKNLVPTEGNPRQLTERQAKDLEKSLKKFNLVDIPAINIDNRIISGHQRIAVLRALGREDEEIDVRAPNRELTEEEHREYMLRANKNLGEWNYDLLANFDEDLLKDVGFESEELDNIFGLEVDDEFDAEKEIEKVLAGKERRCKEGDLWQLGEHRLYIGDAVKKESWEKVLGNEKINMILTDPPYGLGGYAGRSGKFSPVIGDEGNILRFYKIIPIVEEMYIWGDWKFYSQIVNIFGMPRSIIIWEKPTFGMGRGYRRQYELLFYWGNYKGTKYGDIWKFERENKYQHPTQNQLNYANDV